MSEPVKGMVSVVIPSHNEIYLQKTIDSLLKQARGQIEVIPVLDGYWPKTPIENHRNVRVLHLGKNVGMRDAINSGVRISRGEFIMRTDEHCIFGDGYDVLLAHSCKENYIVTARRYFLDPVQWEVMEKKPVDYERLKARDIGNGAKKFEGVVWRKREIERKDRMIDETMAMQGSMWMMRRSWWDKVIGELQTEGYGTMYQDSHEMVFKTWKAGGKLMVNKLTWFAHKHVSFPRTHQYSRAVWEPCVKYAYDQWKDYYPEVLEKWGL